ncbi:Nuclear cap-binding protein subunit 3 [Podarcis lilfordi]|uniref:Nuclear cap-binding protein subunit 3 n=1 Tax=Podarcis lilfordi TaxID=74358 RepID=A0AA35PRG8_9SAUR|nr:Nuclear cap-binding protein subunit 3 [Podarcis lilfordi]
MPSPAPLLLPGAICMQRRFPALQLCALSNITIPHCSVRKQSSTLRAFSVGFPLVDGLLLLNPMWLRVLVCCCTSCLLLSPPSCGGIPLRGVVSMELWQLEVVKQHIIQWHTPPFDIHFCVHFISEKQEESSDDEAEEGEVEDDHPNETELDTLSQAEEDSLLRNDLRPASKLAKGNKLFMRFATRDDKKELGAARRSQYYMKYGNPNYGGMKGILSNSWKRRYHSRRLHRDVIKKRTLIGDDVGLTPPYKHRHSGLVNVPEEPIEEEEEEEDDDDQDMDEDDRVVVEYRDELQAFKQSRERSASRRSSAASESDSDEMDYDLELKMISTPSPKKSMKMTMYADEVESQLKSIRNSMRADSVAASNIKNRIGSKGTSEKVADVRLLLEEKRQGNPSPRQPLNSVRSDVRQRLGKRPHSPEAHTPPGSPSTSHREPLSDVHSRLGIPKQDGKGLYSDTREKKSANLWTRLGSAAKVQEKVPEKAEKSSASPEEEDSELQRAWGALIKEKEQSRQKKSRLDNLPSLQIEISRESSSGSDTES